MNNKHKTMQPLKVIGENAVQFEASEDQSIIFSDALVTSPADPISVSCAVTSAVAGGGN